VSEVAQLLLDAGVKVTDDFPKTFTRVACGTPIAKLYQMWQGATFKVVCKEHKQCNLMVQVAWFPSVDSAMLECCRWIVSAGGYDEQSHWRAARAIVDANKKGAAAK
jgi:hypothetical protein